MQKCQTARETISGRPQFAMIAAGLIAGMLIVLLSAMPAASQIQPSTCLAVADNQFEARVWKASLAQRASSAADVNIYYVGHSAFRITTPGGIDIVTDYSGSPGPGDPPEIVTMNHAHGTHYTDNPDPRIPHVLRGWGTDGAEKAEHHIELDDVIVRNVSTDLYYNGALLEKDGNSIFIFEAAGLCIGHLGHLHHKLTAEHIARIGRIDVLFIPVDGTYTMSLSGMIELSKQLRSSVIIPMHFFSGFSLQQFLGGMRGEFEIFETGAREMTVSLHTLPETPTVNVLMPF